VIAKIRIVQDCVAISATDVLTAAEQVAMCDGSNNPEIGRTNENNTATRIAIVVQAYSTPVQHKWRWLGGHANNIICSNYTFVDPTRIQQAQRTFKLINTIRETEW